MRKYINIIEEMSWPSLTKNWRRLKTKCIKIKDCGTFAIYSFPVGSEHADLIAVTNDEVIGGAFFNPSEDNLNIVGDVEVHTEWRRRGVATALYDAAEEFLGKEAIPNVPHSQEAEAFWLTRKKNDK